MQQDLQIGLTRQVFSHIDNRTTATSERLAHFEQSVEAALEANDG